MNDSLRCPPGVTLLLGGARSGKSDLAVRLAMGHDGPVAFVATAAPGDDDMVERIARHRDERPADWVTVEETIDLASAVERAGSDTAVVVDCLTLWVSNLMLGQETDVEIHSRARALVDAVTARSQPTIVVTNEVGSGLVPDNELGRRYRDVLGRVNRIVTDGASRSALVVAGQVLELRGPQDIWS